MNRAFPAYGDLDSEVDFIEDYEETPVISKKDWFKPANASLARLDKVKPVSTVYNLGLRDPRDLQAGRGRTTPLTADLQTGRSKTTPVSAGDQLSDLQTEPPLSTVSYQKAAWGSQTSIPELFKQAAQAGTHPTRPSSAKTGSISKPPIGRKCRPQSAKDPLCPPGKKKAGSKFGVKGQKFDPSERGGKHGLPPGGGCVGWAGPPAGLCDPHHPVDNLNTNQSARPRSPRAPNTSPEPQDESNHCENSQPFSPPPSPPFCLSLSLPSADVDASDEPDTGRLMADAEKYVKTQKKKHSQKMKYFKADMHSPGRISEAQEASQNSSQQNPVLVSDNSHDQEKINSTANDFIPELDYDFTRELTSHERSFEEGKDTTKGQKAAYHDDNHEGSCPSGEDWSNGDPSTKLSLNLEGVNDGGTEMEPEKALPPSNGFDLEYLGPAKQEKKNRNHPIFLMPDKRPSLQKEVKTPTWGHKPQADRDTGSINEDKTEPKLKEKHREASSTNATDHNTSTHSAITRAGVHIREDRNVTVDITPRNLGRKVTGQSSKKHRAGDDLVNFEIRNKLSEKPKTGEESRSLEITPMGAKTRTVSPVGRAVTPAATISVVYDDNDSQTTMEKKKKARRRGHVKEKDLVTMVSNISLSDEDDDDSDDPGQEMDINIGDGSTDQGNAHMGRSPSSLSTGERNYYDIARKQTKVGNKDDPTGSEEKENLITMTTKTILFDLEKPRESVVKTILDAPLTKHRDRFGSAFTEKPVTRPKSANRPKSVKLSKSDLQCISPVASPLPVHDDDGDEDGGFSPLYNRQSSPDEERPESRMGFVAMEEDKRTKSDVEENSCSTNGTKVTGISQRPPSGRRRPLSTTSKTLNRPSSSSSRQHQQGAKESVLSKRRPQSASSVTSPSPSAADVQRANAAAAALRCERETTAKTTSFGTTSRFADSKRHYASYTNSSRKNRAKSASVSHRPVQIFSNNPILEAEDTEAMEECKEIQNRLACYGIDIKPQTLERALFPPTGKTLYYQVDAQLPKSYSNGLLSHPRYWLPEEHRRLKLAEKKLAMAELSLWRQKKEEERKARLAAGKEKSPKKGKKKGKKKLRRSQSIC